MGYENFRTIYQESTVAEYDPLHNRVVQGLSKGMTEAEFKLMHSHQHYNEFASDLSLKPDIITGHKGEQLAIFVLHSRDIMTDSMRVDGRNWHMMQLTKNKMRPVPVAIEKIVDFDLQNFKLKMKPEFKLDELLGVDFYGEKDSQLQMIQFCHKLTNNVDVDRISGNLDFFIDQLVKYFQMKARMDLLHEPEQMLAALDEIKICLLQVQLQHDTILDSIDKYKVEQSLNGQTFSELIDALKKDLNKMQSNWESEVKTNVDERFDASWQGTRQAVELPTN